MEVTSSIRWLVPTSYERRSIPRELSWSVLRPALKAREQIGDLPYHVQSRRLDGHEQRDCAIQQHGRANFAAFHPLLGRGLILPLLPRASFGSTQDFQPRSKCDLGKSVQL